MPIVYVILGLRLLIIVSIIIWCAVMPGYKAVSRAVLIIFGCLLGVFTGIMTFGFGFLYATLGDIVVDVDFYMIELIMAVYLFTVTWKTHSWKYKVPAGIVGILNVLIAIATNKIDWNIYAELLYGTPEGRIILYKTVIFQSIGLIITLIVIWVMLIQFLQTNSNGKYSSSVIVCPVCGARLEEQLNFCPKCGYRFK